jgi:hypothetical protein
MLNRLKINRNNLSDSILRAGKGLYCEEVIYNNLFDRPYREKRMRFSRPASRLTEGQRSAESNI